MRSKDLIGRRVEVVSISCAGSLDKIHLDRLNLGKVGTICNVYGENAYTEYPIVVEFSNNKRIAFKTEELRYLNNKEVVL